MYLQMFNEIEKIIKSQAINVDEKKKQIRALLEKNGKGVDAQGRVLEDLTIRFGDGEAIYEASKKKYVHKTKGLTVNAPIGGGGFRILGLIAEMQHPDASEIARWLVTEQGALINLGDEFGRPPLYFAARVGDIKMINALLDVGADINQTITSSYGDSKTGGSLAGEPPLFAAIRYGQVKAVDLLRTKGAQVVINVKFHGAQDALEKATNIYDKAKDFHENQVIDPIFGSKNHCDTTKIPSLDNMGKIVSRLSHSSLQYVQKLKQDTDGNIKSEAITEIQDTFKHLVKYTTRITWSLPPEIRTQILFFQYHDPASKMTPQQLKSHLYQLTQNAEAEINQETEDKSESTLTL